MPLTTRHLLHICARELTKRHRSHINLGSDNNDDDENGGLIYSLGDVQRKSIRLAGTVNDVLGVFEDVEAIVKIPKMKVSRTTATLEIDDDNDGLETGDGGSSTSSSGDDEEGGSSGWYKMEEIDWFAIEAYNRGVSFPVVVCHVKPYFCSLS